VKEAALKTSVDSIEEGGDWDYRGYERAMDDGWDAGRVEGED